jgi:hypothetical protein
MYGLTLTDAAFFDDRPDMRWDQLPVVRSFFRQEPAMQTKQITQLYDAIDSATEARRTMRAMDRRWRPEIATEIDSSQENQLYGQMSFADKRMRTFRAEMDAIYQTPTLTDVRNMAQERAKATRESNLVSNAKLTGAWNDLGALKRFLLDDLLRERNAFADSVMKDVEQRRDLGATQ